MGYFEGRHWDAYTLESRVAVGLRMAQVSGKPFTWLTCTNEGAADVCKATKW